MENGIQVGDKVRISVSWLFLSKGATGIVKKIYDNRLIGVLMDGQDNLISYFAPSDLEVVQTKEQMEEACLRQWQSELDELNKMELDNMQHPEKQFSYETAIDWVKYEAQLAHDIAIEYVRINRYLPEVLGDIAVTVARSIVEGLKKK